MDTYKRNISSNVYTKLIKIFIMFIFSVIVARSLGPMKKGAFDYIFLIFVLLSSYGHFGILNANIHFIKKSKYERNEVYCVNLTYLILNAIILSGIIITIYLKGLFLNNYSSSTIIIGVLYILFTYVFSFYTSLLIGEEKIVIMNKIILICDFINLIFLILLWIFKYINLETIFFSYLLALCMKSFILMLKYPVQYNIKFNILILMDEVKYGGIICLSAFIVYLFYRVDQIIIKSVLGEWDLGIYSLGVMLAELLLLIPTSITTALMGNLYNSKYSSENVKKIVADTLKYVFYISIISVVFGIIFTPLVSFVYGSEYNKAIPVVIILFLGLAFISIPKIAQPYFFYLGKPHVHLIISIITLIINLICNIFLINLLGIIGVALASTVSYIVYGCLYVFVLITKENFMFKDLFFLSESDLCLIKEKVSYIIQKI